MKEKVRQSELNNRFYFNFFGYDPELERKANLRLLELLAYAPPSAGGFGRVEMSGREYISTIIIQSPFRSFTSKALSSNADSAVRKSLERMEEDLFRWRFGNGTGNNGKQTGLPSGTQMPLAGVG